MNLAEQIAQRNNKALDDDIKRRTGLSKAATIYYQLKNEQC